MAEKRTAQNLAEFAKLNDLGSAVFGLVQKYGTNSQGPFVVLSPAGYRPNKAKPFERFEELALGLSTDLSAKVQPSDTGSIVLVVLVATKPTSKSPMKIFNVWNISAEEAQALLKGSDLNPEWLKVDERETGTPRAVQGKLPF